MKPIEEHIVDIVRELDAIPNKRESKRAKEIVAELVMIGRTAAFFNDYEGMKALHDAAEELVGNTNEIGYWLNGQWDGIGSWCA